MPVLQYIPIYVQIKNNPHPLPAMYTTNTDLLEAFLFTELLK